MAVIAPLPQLKNRWLFILGRETWLSLAEIKAVFLLNKISYKIANHHDNHLIINCESRLETEKLINTLGGTIKIAQSIDKLNAPKALSEFLSNYIPTGKIEFSISGNAALGIETKKILKQTGRKARYIEAKNSATIIYNNLIDNGADIEIYQGEAFLTRAIQPIEEFSKRDFGRPGRDDVSGMLPPKLAMMMINLAMISKDKTILDPFCGSGTIISEAALLGYEKIIGSDISAKATTDTSKNIQWLKNNFKNIKSNIKIDIFTIDATKISQKIEFASIDAIIGEPYLGRPLTGRENPEAIEKQIGELKHLYILAFTEFHKILKPDGVIVFIIPRFKTRNGWINIDCLKEIEKLGFKNEPTLTEQKHLLYYRDNQHLGREIWRFKKI